MSVIAFTYKATPENLAQVELCLKILETDNPRIFNIPTHRIEDHVQADSIVVTFGRIARITVQQYISEKHFTSARLVELPHPSRLSPKGTNIETRYEANKKLQELKELLALDMFQPSSVDLTIKETDLPELDARQLLLLQKVMEEAGKTSSFQATKGGKLIEISSTPIEDSKADIHLTFQEIYTLRAIMDTLKVTEVQLVTYHQASSTEPDGDTT